MEPQLPCAGSRDCLGWFSNLLQLLQRTLGARLAVGRERYCASAYGGAVGGYLRALESQKLEKAVYEDSERRRRVKAIVAYRPGDLRLVDVVDPSPGPGEVVVAVRACGICGGDLDLTVDRSPTDDFPLIPGHEPWGEVVELGSGADPALLGTLVAIDPTLPCGRCRQCWRGRTNLCEQWGAIGVTQSGAWAEYVTVPQRNAHTLEDDFPVHLGVLIEPLACALYGVRRLRPEASQSAIIFGAGTMGILLGVLLRLRDIDSVLFVDPNAARREAAERIVSATAVTPEDLGEVEAEIVVDASGNPEAISSLVYHATPGATVMLFGVAPQESLSTLPPYSVFKRDLTIVGSMGILHTFEEAVREAGRHAKLFSPLVTDNFALQDFESGIEKLKAGSSIKVCLVPESSLVTT